VRVRALAGGTGAALTVVDMVKGWIKVKYTPKKSRKSLIGWIETEWLCPNPVTTCP